MSVSAAPAGGVSTEETELQHTLDKKRAALELVAHQPEAQQLPRAAASESGTEKLYALLEHRVQLEEFVEELARSRQELAAGQPAATAAAPAAGAAATAATPATAQQQPPTAGSPGEEVLQADWWEVRPGGEGTLVSELTGEYVLVEHSDVVAALSSFIAAYIVTLPEAHNLDPRQLQRAVAMTLQELRKGRVRRLLDWGKELYRLGAVGYGAFSMFSNPWVAKAVLAALWTAFRMIGRFLY